MIYLVMPIKRTDEYSSVFLKVFGVKGDFFKNPP